MVLNKLVKIGGEYLDNAVANLVRHNRDFLIGRLTAEALRKIRGFFDRGGAHATMQVAGRNLITGVPQLTEIPIGLVRAALGSR